MADLQRHEELVVITKTYDLILLSCHHTDKFPRNHRFVLGESGTPFVLPATCQSDKFIERQAPRMAFYARNARKPLQTAHGRFAGWLRDAQAG